MARWALPALAVLAIAGLAATQRPGGQAGQLQGGMRIGFVNSQLILRQLPGYAVAESTYNKELEGFQSEIQRLRLQFDSTMTAYQQSSVALSPAQRQAREAALRQQQQQLEQRSTQLRQRADERQRELVSPLEERVKAVIEGLRAERNIALIFDVAAPGGGIISADQTLDLTSVVVQRLKGKEQ